MKRAFLAALIALAPTMSLAQCFVHPDTGALYCSSAASCPIGSTWNPATQACASAMRASCSGSDSGVYTPAVLSATNIVWAAPQRTFWTRVGAIVTVAGTIRALPTTNADYVQLMFAPPIGTTFSSEYDITGVSTTGNGTALAPPAATFGGLIGLFLHGEHAQYAQEGIRYSYTYRIAECP
jgi:hypothetical protein